MIHRSIRTTALTTTILLALAASPALGQQHQQGQQGEPGAMTGHGHMMMHGNGMQGAMMGSGAMGMGMMGMMSPARPGPGALLQAADALELTGEQQEQLTELRDRAQAEHDGYMQAMMATHQEAATLRESPDDLDAYETALRNAADLMVEAHLSMTRTALEAQEILTPEQREKARAAAAMTMPMMDGHSRDGGMKGKGMHPGSPR